MLGSRARTLVWLLALLALGGIGSPAPAARAQQPPPPPPRTAQESPFTFQEHLMLPVRVHLIRAEEAEALNGSMTPEEAREVIRRVNEIWAQAGIQFWIESVLMEQAVNQEEWLAGNRSTGSLRQIRPPDSLGEQIFHLYFIGGGMSPNGVAMTRELTTFVKESLRLREVEGGIDLPIARTTAHEFGHFLGLSHRQDTTNLLASGTTGILLNAEEVDRSRSRARSFAWHLTAPGLLEIAELRLEAEETEVALEMFRAVAATPGTHEAKERAEARVEALEAPPPDPPMPRFHYEEHLLVPVRVHLIRADVATDLNSSMTPDGARELIRRVNEIWAQAGIQFWVESVLVEQAANQQEWLDADSRSMRQIRPESSRASNMLHLHMIGGGMRANGVAMSGNLSFVRERPGSRRVPGGHDWPAVRVTGHEFGHNLSLRHRQDRTNLLASGTRGWELNAAEVERARSRASSWSWHRTPEALLEEAEALLEAQADAERGEAARDMLRALTQIPGTHGTKWRAYELLAEIDGG